MNQKLVLVVDDEPSIRETIVELMELEGYATLSAENGELALKMLSETPRLPDIILLDLMMPICSGYDFIPKMRAQKRFATIPLIIISAAQDAEEFAQSQSCHYAKKPLDASDLLSAVEGLTRT
jgi:CheY-like chemotaxis protein